MDLAHLPTIVEIKRTLDGRRKEFRCRLVEGTPDRAIVLFVSSEPYDVGGLALPPGTVTLGHFWRGRDYNVYHWLTPTGTTLAHYFNLAADTFIEAGSIHWRDLTVDVLVRPGRDPVVLDEDELPPDLDDGTRDRIVAARADIQQQHVAITGELEELASRLWPRLFQTERA